MVPPEQDTMIEVKKSKKKTIKNAVDKAEIAKQNILPVSAHRSEEHARGFSEK